MDINKIASELKAPCIDFCRKLIQTPALSGDEKRVADLYLSEMKKLGYDDVFRDEWGNVVGLIFGTQPGPTIMYNAHLDHPDAGERSEWGGYDPYGAEMDIVEVDNQDKTGKEQAEVIHGRAAADVKGGGACQVYSGAALLKMRENGKAFKGTFMFTGVVLEEPAEQLGMIKLIDETLPQKGLSYDCVVSSEPSSLKLYLGHRGKMLINIIVSGRTSHASAPWLGINAASKAAKIINRIEEKLPQTFKSEIDLGTGTIALLDIRCTPEGDLPITPDRCCVTYDRRTVPGENEQDCIEEIRKIIEELKQEDPEISAEVKLSKVLRTSYTGKSEVVPNLKQPWKISLDHLVVKTAARALENIGQPAKYGYWDAGTDLSKVCATDRKPAIGYSPMQEQYCHTPKDLVRTDYMEKNIAGNVAIFFQLTELAKDVFRLD